MLKSGVLDGKTASTLTQPFLCNPLRNFLTHVPSVHTTLPCYLPTLLPATSLPCYLPPFLSWSTGGENGGKAEDSVMNQHYLRNVSVEVCLANGGFNARHWNHYLLPRGRAGKLTDDYVQRLIEHLFPDLYSKVRRAKSAFDGLPEHPDDAISTTNWRFLENLQIITLFWLQDAVVLMTDIPEIASAAPWNLLTGGGQVTTDFERLGTEVRAALEAATLTEQTKVLEQNDLLRSVHAGCIHTADALDSRLSNVPGDVSEYVLSIMRQEDEARREQLLCDVVFATQETYRRMITAASGQSVPEAARPSPSRKQASSSRKQASSSSSPLLASDDEDEDEDDEDDEENGSNRGDGTSQDTGSDQVAGSSRVAGSSQVAGSGPVAGSSNHQAANRASQAAGDFMNELRQQCSNHRPLAAGGAGGWKIPDAPRPLSMAEAAARKNACKRKPRPAPNSSKTGPREDGFYLGNDLNTVSQVWQAYKDLQQYLEANPDKGDTGPSATPVCGWACTIGDSTEKSQQTRMRARRRLLWDAISASGGDKEALVAELDAIQQRLKSGISRVEAWAVTLKKQHRDDANCGATILSVAQEYEQGKVSTVAATESERPSGV